MQLLTIEWIDKAEGDFATAQREIQARKQPNYVRLSVAVTFGKSYVHQ
jgi:hypothetical protein